MNNKFVGWGNIILGGFGLVYQVVMLAVVYPKMQALYDEFGTDLPWLTRNFPFVTMGVITILAGVIFLGFKLAFGKNPQVWMSKAGIAGLVLMLVLGGWYVGMSVLSIVTPLYSLTSNI